MDRKVEYLVATPWIFLSVPNLNSTGRVAMNIGGRGSRRAVSRGRGERGAAAVEFALVLPLLLTILFGSITAGISYSNSIGLQNAVREGSRFGATTVAGGSWGSDVTTRTGQLQFDDPGAESAICAQLVEAPATVKQTHCIGDETIQDQLLADPPAVPTAAAGACMVQVWAGRPYSIVTAIVPSVDGVMVRKSVALYEGLTC